VVVHKGLEMILLNLTEGGKLSSEENKREAYQSSPEGRGRKKENRTKRN